jgi:thiol:disulfide interchange protein DsbG
MRKVYWPLSIVLALFLGAFGWFLMFGQGQAMAQVVSDATARAEIQQASHGHAQVIRIFHLREPVAVTASARSLPKKGTHSQDVVAVHGPVITGAVVQYPNHSQHIIFVLPDHLGIVTGSLFARNGGKKPLNLIAAQKYLPKPPIVAGRVDTLQGPAGGALPLALIQKLATLDTGFTWGHGTPQFTVFVDPNCIYCHRFYDAARPMVNRGKLTVRIIPVAILKKSSIPRAQEILSGKNPLALWLQSESHFHVVKEEGDLPVTGLPVDVTGENDVDKNTAILYHLDGRRPVTPTFLLPNGNLIVGWNPQSEALLK